MKSDDHVTWSIFCFEWQEIFKVHVAESIYFRWLYLFFKKDNSSDVFTLMKFNLVRKKLIS